ncbi:M28 family metallopeptidase [Cohnella lubricantis]|uniref:M20/M25/M40 family metallo-hydrolase n=1 Tax=Cohnella lubricantis TaxID=2163172 RepID=A0A841TD65_9BACL|nr:M28 family metallopeptidase [Cohnella lubricantis]MBB6676917.1 M20/M25/M40 family metallo-hydrolase [Cohnella lubricantis]MBP2118319.1 hypothetical protein [Cohnella lubricantis]
MNPSASLQRILHDIAALSADPFEGRLSGTAGARGAARYLADALAHSGAVPVGEDGFFTAIQVPAARLTGAAKLRVDGQELKHRIDYAEWSPLSAGGSAIGQLATVRFDEEIDQASLAGRIVLIPSRPEGFDVAGTIQSAADIRIAALLIESGHPKSFHKTVIGREANRIPVLRVQRSIAERYAGLEGIHVELDLPLETSTLPCQNVLGFLPGKDTGTTLLLSAHYDHLGDDPAGLRFPGSIDNASGAAVILEAARLLAGESHLPFNILIAFLSGEESGMWGARQLAADPPVPITMAINLDCLGFEPELNALRTGHAEPGHWLGDLAAKVIELEGIEVKRMAGGDDSAAFLAQGIPTIGLGQKPTLDSSVRIHTAEDNPEHIHAKPLEQGLDVLLKIIRQLNKTSF